LDAAGALRERITAQPVQAHRFTDPANLIVNQEATRCAAGNASALCRSAR
jgi:hypothetical protein